MIDVDFYRLAFSFTVGYFLTLSGSLSQLITNNKLASPSTIGMDGFAVLFVIIAQFGISFHYIEGTLFNSSFVLFFVGLGLLQILKFRNSESIWSHLGLKDIILIGLSFNLVVGAMFSIIQFMFMSYALEFPSGLWFGSFKQYETSSVYLFVIIFICLLFYLPRLAKNIQLLNLGPEFSLGMNVSIREFQKRCLVISLFLTGLVICYFGVFSFFGLILPHILRNFKFFSVNMKNEILKGPFVGAFALCGLDYLCYAFTFQGIEFPVGMISSVLGSLLLIFLLVNSRIKST